MPPGRRRLEPGRSGSVRVLCALAETPGGRETKGPRGHCLRGHAESLIFHLARDLTIETGFGETDMVDRAGHSFATFQKSYSRPAVQRQLEVARKHRNMRRLTIEEAQFL